FLPNQRLGALDIDRAPDAGASPWREPNLVIDFVNALPNSVDPTEAERLIHRLGPCDARPSRILCVKPNPKLSRRRVILLQPRSEIRGRSEKLRFQPICVLYAEASFRFLRSSGFSILRTNIHPWPYG